MSWRATWKALHSTSMDGTYKIIQTLISAGADIAALNECDSTPLYHVECRKLLKLY